MRPKRRRENVLSSCRVALPRILSLTSILSTGGIHELSPFQAVTGVSAVPYMILTNTRPKCVTVVAPAETTLVIDYDAPDMIIPDEKELDERKDEKKGQGQGQDEKRQYGSGYDKAYYERHQQKIEAAKRALNMRADMSLLITQKGETINAMRDRWQRPRPGEKVLLPQATKNRFELTERKGTVTFDTTQDGTVEICTQSMTANPGMPCRVALSVSEKAANPPDKELEEGQHKAEQELTRMEGTLGGLIRKVDLILSQADFAKEEEVKFHEQSLAMNRASQWWPILHLTVLLITAFTQVNHMIRFFKNRHIF